MIRSLFIAAEFAWSYRSRDGGRTFAAAIEADRRGIAAVAEGADGALLLFGEAGIKTRPAPFPAP